jgi:hypothetical protein
MSKRCNEQESEQECAVQNERRVETNLSLRRLVSRYRMNRRLYTISSSNLELTSRAAWRKLAGVTRVPHGGKQHRGEVPEQQSLGKSGEGGDGVKADTVTLTRSKSGNRLRLGDWLTSEREIPPRGSRGQ